MWPGSQLSIISIINAKLKLDNYNRGKPEILRFLWDIVVFRLVLYICRIWSVLYYNLYTTLHIYESSCKFDTVLYQFLETETSDRCIICIVQRLRFSGFILYSLSFFLYSPFTLVLIRFKRSQLSSFDFTFKYDKQIFLVTYWKLKIFFFFFKGTVH